MKFKKAAEGIAGSAEPIETSLVQQALESDNSKPLQINTPLIGRLVGFNSEGDALVTHEYSELVQKALSVTVLTLQNINALVTLAFDQGDASKPIILGVIQTPALSDEKVVLKNENGIVLECGDAKIELDADGHILVQGVTIKNQAYGTNHLKGGAVKIN